MNNTKIAESNKEIVIITGASTGIGAATARELAIIGFHVLAGVRKERDSDALRAPGLEPVILDVTNADHIKELVKRVEKDKFKRKLRALVNNAGIGVNAPVEVYNIDEWRNLFEVNFFGHMAMTQAFLPDLIRNKGRVINLSSVGGKMAMATYGPYAGTKFALEAVSDALRREVGHLGVDVIVIEPGAVRTEIAGGAISTAEKVAATLTPEQNQRYGRLIQAINEQTKSAMKSGASAEDAAKVLAKAITVSKPRTRYTIGREATLLPLVLMLPDRWLDWIFTRALKPFYKKK